MIKYHQIMDIVRFFTEHIKIETVSVKIRQFFRTRLSSILSLLFG